MNDAQRVMLYDAGKKSVSAAYLLWFFLGHFGAHRFYLGKTGTAITMLLLTLIAVPLCFILVGFLILGVVWLWLVIDLFLIPGITRDFNVRLATAYAQ